MTSAAAGTDMIKQSTIMPAINFSFFIKIPPFKINDILTDYSSHSLQEESTSYAIYKFC
jgi:hypothetical protein